jgi:iron complex outermembrane recepter protein
VKRIINGPLAAISVAVGASFALVPGATSAQETAGARALEEIVVTARKREEDLQDLGGAISALGAGDLARRHDVDLLTLSNMAPNVIIHDIQQGPGGVAAISIRGIGTTDLEKNFDPTAGVVLDGVFIGVNSGAIFKAVDLEKVEVLRGPQGTLFGRNSIAGVINVGRGRPDFDGLSSAVRASYGRFNDAQFDGYVNLPVNDMLAFRLGGAYRESDGFFDNATIGEKVGDKEYFSVSPSFTFRPTEDIDIYYRFDRTRQKQDADILHNMARPDQLFCFFYNQCAESLTVPQSGSRYVGLQEGALNTDGVYQPYENYFATKLHIANVHWNVNDSYSVDYIFGDFETDEKTYQDWDGTPWTLYHTDRPATWSQRSHELRLNFGGERLHYTAGVYVWDADYYIDNIGYIGFFNAFFPEFFPAATPIGSTDPIAAPQSVAQSTESRAVFFEADYDLTDAWTLTVGGRQTKDKKDNAVRDPSPFFGWPAGTPGGDNNFDDPFKVSYSKFTGKLGLRYRFNDDLMLYGLVSEGFRAGGFGGRPGTYLGAATPYDPETVRNFELGWKSELFDRRIRLNGSVFLMTYDDKQEEQSIVNPASATGQETLVLNAGEVEMRGIELDFLGIVTDRFTLAGNLGMLDHDIKTLIDPLTGTDLSYLDLRRAPRVTATLSPTYRFFVAGGELTLTADVRYIGSHHLTFLNDREARNDSAEVVDASIMYTFDNTLGETSISLWGLNLTKDDSWTQGYNVGSGVEFAGLWTYTAVRTPRTYGIRISHRHN